MKFLHTSDLHLGKTIYDVFLLEDQRVILHQISGIAKAEAVDAVVIAGDVYDRSIPPAEAVSLLNDFLEDMTEAHIPVLMISGNHDSGERLSFANKALEESDIYIAGGRQKPIRKVTLEDNFGPVHFYLMPFLKPARYGAKDTEGAVREIFSGEEYGISLRPEERNVLVTHFFVTAGGKSPELSESESHVDVGGIDNVDASLFEQFDYTALGHIHKAQKIGQQEVWYSGAPLATSFSETEQKSVQLVTLAEKGSVTVERRFLYPKRPMRIVEGYLEQVMQFGAGDLEREDYVQIRLHDKKELIDPIGQLRSVYPNVLQLVFAQREEVLGEGYVATLQHRQKGVVELFGDFYESVQGEALNEEQREMICQVAESLSE